MSANPAAAPAKVRKKKARKKPKNEGGKPKKRKSQKAAPRARLSVPYDPHAPPTGKYLAALSLAALGVVYGDIGTSPLYAIRECFHGPHAIPPTPANVLGVLSLIFWSLVIVISVKYLAYVMRADHDGEGGILALMALACPPDAKGRRGPMVMILLGVFGSALLYG
ncbi:MAG TPA: KUP/HAK/KT family potassium transporter, partial [Polyangiaceae bacterium]|nr:KUP/HAK/KT family potassium transporter [Polyangiaceae bacterium]